MTDADKQQLADLARVYLGRPGLYDDSQRDRPAKPRPKFARVSPNRRGTCERTFDGQLLQRLEV